MADRRALFARLERLRTVERQEALARLAAARAEQARMDDVARRSRALIGDGGAGAGAAHDGGGGDGASLAAAAAFHARLAGLVRDAERLGAQADAAELAARTAFAEADQRLERVRERRGSAARDAANQHLARSLLNSLNKPRGPF